jgi:tetratricopeptide (TPR) repeat protein
MTCDYVKRYLDGFLDEGLRKGFDIEKVSEHVRLCSTCYDQLAKFFRTIELAPSSYLKETLDELCLAMYRLAGSVLRERKDPEDNTENVVAVAGGRGGSSREHVEHGHEMIADVEDYVGSGEVSGRNLGDVRRLLDTAEQSEARKVDLAIVLCEEIGRFPTRHRASAMNLLGVLRLWRNRLKEAEAAFLQALSEPDYDEDSRIARASALCNLGYAQQLNGDLEKASKSARRSQALCEELGIDPFHALFALLYFSLLRNGAGLADARDALGRILALNDGRRRIGETFALENNKPILDAFRGSPLFAEHPDLIASPGISARPNRRPDAPASH